MADTFGVVAGSVWRSRMRKLDRLGKLTYLYLHINPHRNSLGLYSLPIMFAADDMDETPDDVKKAIGQIADLGLADYDFDESLVRVRNWELLNAPQGPQDAIGRVYKFDKAPRHAFTFAAFLGCMREVMLRAKRNEWSDDKGIRTKMESLFYKRAEQWFMDYPDLFIRGFSLAGIAPQDSVFARSWEQVSYRDNIPSQYPIDTKTQTKTLSKTQTENRDTRARNSAKPPPATPAKGKRAARKTSPDDVLASIAALEKRAGK